MTALWWSMALVALALGFLLGKRWPAPPQEPTPPPLSPHEDAIPPLLHAVGQVLPNGLLIVDTTRHIVYANQSAGGLLQLPGGELLGQSLIAALRDYYADELAARVLSTGEPESLLLERAEGRQRVLVSVDRFAEPWTGGVVVLRDMTTIVNLERARRDLVANVSHELRTPLTSIRLLVETLASDPPPDVAARMLRQIDDETQAMTHLIDELRELAQIEGGRLVLQVEPTVLRDVVSRAVERVIPQARHRSLAVSYDVPPDLPRVLIDPERIGQVLLNLLSNALKFTAGGGAISVSAGEVCTDGLPPRVARADLEAAEWLVVSVADTGVGIPHGELERIFERFYKLDRARTRNGTGTGLGLAIAKHLVEQHGGRLWAESQPGLGSTFHFLLPRA